MQRDMEIFFNLVEFCKLVLPDVQTHYFKRSSIFKLSLIFRWLFIYLRDSFALGNQYPLVSGVYKLLTIAMRISENYRYFEVQEIIICA